jgi:hypothetical protein
VTAKPPDPGNEKAALAGGSLKTGNYNDPIQQERGVKRGCMTFFDPGAESAVVGVIETGLFDRIHGSKLVPANAFNERKWQIPYSAALALRKAGIPVCTKSVCDFIEKNRLDGERAHEEVMAEWKIVVISPVL